MTSSYGRLLSSIGFLALALAPSRAWAVTQNFCSFQAPLTTWTLNQNAFEALNSEIRLTDAVAAETGSAWLTAPIALTATTSVNAYFTFQMGPSPAGGDGLAFVMQNSAAGATALGTGALQMGYGGITPSVIVQFNTYKNSASDPNANNVSLMLNGSSTVFTATGTPAFTMAGAGMLYAWVGYDGAGKTISVYVSKTATKPGAPIFTHALNLFTQLGAQMFVGFTSATGVAPELNEHDVYELEISTGGVPCTCEGDSACSGATPACATSGVCAICSATNAAACTGATPVCDVPVNSCVGCLTNASCASPHPICDSAALTCRACKVMPAGDCGGSTPKCATTGPNAGDCVLCLADPDCPPLTPRCTPTNTCVQCLSAADCGGDTPVCNGGTCMACASDADCGGATPACEVWGACGQCSSTNASACTGALTICDFPTGTCVGCEFNSDCSGMTPTCTSHTCVPCTINADCAGNPAGPACVTSGMKMGSCVICQVDGDCTSPAAPKCDTVANLCVQCQQNADCAAPTPVCNKANICVGCLADADCSGSPTTPVCDATSSQCKPCANDYSSSNPGPLPCPTAALPACQPTGTPLAGQCALCSSLNDSACATLPATPVCITSTATCGCVVDSDCAADSYCDTSTVTSGVCTPGCRLVDAGAGNCSTGKYCSGTGTVGVCMSEPCDSNSDCKAPNPVCDTIVQPHVCVRCLNDSDCSDKEVCDSSNHCVECTSNQKQNCSAAGAGAACLANETCGCATDKDCGGATSGRVCDMTKHTCTTGCRGSGGNGCPSPQTCSSKDGSAGTCQGASVTASASSSSSGTGTGGTGGGHAGTGGGAGDHVVSQSKGCGCRAAGGDGEHLGALGALVGGLALAARRRRSRPAGRARSTG